MQHRRKPSLHHRHVGRHDGCDARSGGPASKATRVRFPVRTDTDATFRVLISPTPVVGPDRKNKNDNHANAGFTHEGDEVRAFLASQKNLYVVCGDRHWQYVSVDPKTGVREYACGPTSNKHAGGWKNEYRSPMHKYLNVQGGFLRVEVAQPDDKPQLSFRHYDVDGNIANEEVRQVD